MDTFPDFFPVSIQLLLAPNPLRRKLVTHYAAQLARQGPLRVLDGGNRFDLRNLARTLRRQTRQYHEALGGVLVARAFTCYQMTALLAETTAQPIPTLVPDLLTTFQDESVDFVERQRLFGACLTQLQRLGRQAILFVSADPQTPDLLSSLVSVSGHVWQFEMPKIRKQQRLL